jgi:4-amino-4-deoxy-L-arabinose transferase-like glycosyltransferase
MKRFLIAILFISIIVSAGTLRFYNLGKVPASPDWDEVALGYNAYSVLKTGRDEYGTRFPLSLRSYDDYKPPLYMYLSIPSIAAFGLNVWSVRLPSAVMGMLAVVGVYFLTSGLLFTMVQKKKEDDQQPSVLQLSGKAIPVISLISMFLLAVSPWHIQFSRIAFEANVGITLNIWAVVFFFWGIRKKGLLTISGALFALSLYAYHSERVFSPLLVLILAITYHKELFERKHIKYIVAACFTGILIVLPLIPVVFSKTAILRLRGTSSFTDQTGLLAKTVAKLEDDRANGIKIGEVFDNRRLVFVKTIISGYLSHYSFKWLFLTGDNPRHHAPDMGLMYLVELPFLLFGLYSAVKKGGKLRMVLVGWVLIAPVAASPTTELPHAIRTLVFLPSLQIITAIGVYQCIMYCRNRTRLIGYTALGVVSLFATMNFMYYLNMYFVQMNHEVSDYWQYGYEEVVRTTEKVKSKYDKIVVSTSLEQPHMFFLFYMAYDPVKYLAAGGTKSGSFAELANGFDKYEFRKIDWLNEPRHGNILYVGKPDEVPQGNVADIRYLDGKPAIEMRDR